MRGVEPWLDHEVYGRRNGAWSKKPTALAGLTMVVGGEGMPMARSILVDVNRHLIMLVDVGRHRLKMVVSETMRRGCVVAKRKSSGGTNYAQRVQHNEQTRCPLTLSIVQNPSHLFLLRQHRISCTLLLIMAGFN